MGPSRDSGSSASCQFYFAELNHLRTQIISPSRIGNQGRQFRAYNLCSQMCSCLSLVEDEEHYIMRATGERDRALGPVENLTKLQVHGFENRLGLKSLHGEKWSKETCDDGRRERAG